MTFGMALELAPHNIRVNCVAPGAVEGDRIDQVIAGQAKARGIGVEEMRKAIDRALAPQPHGHRRRHRRRHRLSLQRHGAKHLGPGPRRQRRAAGGLRSKRHGRAALRGAMRRHRRRHHRLLGRLSSGEARLARRRAAGKEAADLRHHLACRRPHRPAARLEHADQARQVLRGPAARARGRDGPRHRLPPERLAVAGAFGRAPRGAEAPGHHGQGVGRRGLHGVARRGARQVSADRPEGRDRRLCAFPPTARPIPPTSPGAGQGRPPARRAHLREHEGDRHPPGGRPRHRRRHGGGRDPRRVSSSTAPGCGRARSAAWPASTCR